MQPEDVEIFVATVPGLSTSVVSCTCDPCGDDCDDGEPEDP